MIEESKVTLRSSEPYIGGEKETGERIYKHRNKNRELVSNISQYSQNRSQTKERLLTAHPNKRKLLNTSMERDALLKASTFKLVENSYLDTKPEYLSTKETLKSKQRVRPVSAYTNSKIRRSIIVFNV